MPTGQGVTSKAAFKIETGAWGTAIACGAGNQIHFISEGFTPATEYGSSVHLDGRGGVNSLYNTVKKYAGELVIEGHYGGMEALIACAMGMSHQDSSPVSTSTDASQHWFELSGDMSLRAFSVFEMDTPSGNAIRRGSLCFEKTVSVHENRSAVFSGLTIEATPERVVLTLNGAAYAQDYDTGTNPNSAAWTVPAGDQILFDDLTVYLKARDVFTISSANDVFIIDEGGGDVSLDIADGEYSGYGLAQAIATAATNSGSLAGTYRMEYDETNRRFRIFTIDGQTFSVSGVSGSMDMKRTVGMTVDSTTAVSTMSNEDALPDDFSAFDSGDEVGVSKITVSLENALDIDSQDSLSDLYILEPERNGMRRVTGSIEIPRYTNDTFMKAVSGFTTYGMWINFTGAAIDSEYQEMNIFIPQLKFVTGTAPVAGPEIIKQTLNFEAQVPVNFLDVINYLFPDYFLRELGGMAATPISVGVSADGLWTGASTGEIMQLSGTSWSTSTDVDQAIRCFAVYGGDLYVGTDSSRVYKYSGGAWTTSTDIGASQMQDMVVYEDNLYALEYATGKVVVFDGTTWSTSTDTAMTICNHLAVFDGRLFMAGSNNSSINNIYEYTDGGSWGVSQGLGFSQSIIALAVHRGKLYAHINQSLYSYNGSSWVSEGSSGMNFLHMVSWRGLLIGFLSTSGDPYILNIDTGAAVNMQSDFNKTAQMKPIVYDGKLLIPTSSGLFYYQPISELCINIQNEISTNPL